LTTPRWSVWRLIGSVVVIVIAFLASQIAGVIAFAVVKGVRDRGFDAGDWVAQGPANGDALAAASVSSTLICVPLVIAFVGQTPNRWHFLRIQRTSAKTMLVWCGALIALIALSDLLTLSMGRPIVPDVMLQAFSSANPVWLFLALTVFAPAFEELFFRGFMYSGLEAVGARQWVPVVITAALWSMVHLQYDLYGIVSIFVTGLLLGAARRSANSILPCLVMHSANNAIAYFETAYRASTAT
jgi:membrane protease YdiL (CAAX protease family)